MFSDRGHRGRRPQGNDGGPPDPTTGNAIILNNQCPQQPMSSKTRFSVLNNHCMSYNYKHPFLSTISVLIHVYLYMTSTTNPLIIIPPDVISHAVYSTTLNVLNNWCLHIWSEGNP